MFKSRSTHSAPKCPFRVTLPKALDLRVQTAKAWLRLVHLIASAIRRGYGAKHCFLLRAFPSLNASTISEQGFAILVSISMSRGYLAVLRAQKIAKSFYVTRCACSSRNCKTFHLQPCLDKGRYLPPRRVFQPVG